MVAIAELGCQTPDAPDAAELAARVRAASAIRLCFDVPHRRVLEVGCGDGRLLARLAALRFADDLHAVDHSPQAVAALSGRRIEGLTDARTFDGRRLPYASQHFDVVQLTLAIA